MHVLIRAFITGFGLRLGAEAAKALIKRLERASAADDDDDDGGTQVPTSQPDPPEV